MNLFMIFKFHTFIVFMFFDKVNYEIIYGMHQILQKVIPISLIDSGNSEINPICI
jgi:hypothetical protein